MLTAIGVYFLVRLVGGYYITQIGKDKFMVSFSVSPSKIEHLANVMRHPVRILAKVAKMIPQHVYVRMLKRVMKFFLINPQDYKRLSDHLGILISSNRTGLVRLDNKNKLSFISFSALYELYANVEKSLPLGKLSELGNFGEGTTMKLSIKGKGE